MASKPDIVALKWVAGLMNAQAESAESALVEYSKTGTDKQSLLRCMWAVHQITSTLRVLGMAKGELLSLEMERALNYLYKDKVTGERRKLTMGGLMQALKVFPAYLAHTQTTRRDTGQGLEQHVNDLRRWMGERPRPQALFFYMEISATAGITEDASPASDDEVKDRANVMLALYLEMAKSALRGRNVNEGMKTVARVARKMQLLFAGTAVERFWFALIGLCEGIAGGLILPDECIAQIFKTGAFLIKYSRENGAQIDPSVDVDDYLQQMLFYIATCDSKPVHINRIRHAFGIDHSTIESANRGLVHVDAMITALGGAMSQLSTVIDFLNSNDLYEAGQSPEVGCDSAIVDGIEGAACRLEAAGQLSHADSLRSVQQKLTELYDGLHREPAGRHEQVANTVIRVIVDVKIDIEHKLKHGLNNAFCSREYELRESVVTATFTHMGLVENYLHQILRRKALAGALARRQSGEDSVANLSAALKRYLNKSEQGHEELRQAVRDADSGGNDHDLLYRLAEEYLEGVEDISDRKAIDHSLQLLEQMTGALEFAGMEREGRVIEQGHRWLGAASIAGSVREDEAFRCFADSFAMIELHLQRSLVDPLDHSTPMLDSAERFAAQLEQFSAQMSPGSDATSPVGVETSNIVQDTEISADFLNIFVDEAEEIAEELSGLVETWLNDPQVDQVLRDIRRHFHTFKGNGRAVGANVLGELGWAAQDLLDRVIDGELGPSARVQELLRQVVAELPALVSSYRTGGEFDVLNTRQLTNRCFVMAKSSGKFPAAQRSELEPTLPNSPARLAPQAPSVGILGH